MNDQLVRIGWCELFRTATGELVAVPSIPAHTASEYLHATVEGDVVVVTVKKREPCRTDEEAPEIPIGEIGCQERQPLRHFVPSSRPCWWPGNATNGRRHKRHQLYTPKRKSSRLRVACSPARGSLENAEASDPQRSVGSFDPMKFFRWLYCWYCVQAQFA